MPDLDLLRTFLAIYRTGSVTWAAQALTLTEPAVTAQLKSLEASLGRQLFVRLPRGMKPTPAGHALAANVSNHLDQIEVVYQASRFTGDELSGTLVIGGPAEFMTMNVLPALAPLAEKGVSLRVQLGRAEPLQEDLAEGRLDLVISTLRPQRKSLVFEPLYEEEFILVAGPAWATRISPEDIRKLGAHALEGVPLVAYAEDLPMLRRYFESVFQSRIDRAASVVVPDLRAVLEATLAGAGVTVLPRYLCVPYLTSGELVNLYPEAETPRNILYFVQRKGTQAVPRIEAAGRLLRDAALGWNEVRLIDRAAG